jgi:hypothetical protein
MMNAYPAIVPQVLASRRPDGRRMLPASERKASKSEAARSVEVKLIKTRTAKEPGEETDGFSDESDLWLYRDRTVGLLKRYMRLSVEVGRLPSLLGREFFRTRVTSYHVSTFEDAVIFVYDVERSLEKLDPFGQKLVATLALQDYSQEQAARLLNCGRRTVVRRYPETLDRLSDIFLKANILTRLPAKDASCEKTCQEGERNGIHVSQTIQGGNIS